MNDRLAEIAKFGFRPWVDQLDDARWEELRAFLERHPEAQSHFASHIDYETRVRNQLLAAPQPAGFEDRLLASLRTAQEARVTLANTMTADGEEQVAMSPRSTRRRWLAWAAGGCSAALTTAAVVYFARSNPAPLVVSHDELTSETSRWIQATRELAEEQWQPEVASTRSASHPLDAALKRQPRSRASLAARWDASAVVYDFSASGRSAWLYVIDSTANFQLPAAPWQQLPISGPWRVGAWQRDRVLNVMVIDADASLHDLLRSAQVA